MKRIEDRLIFFEDGLGLVSSVLPREVTVYVVVEEHNEVGYLLLLLVGFGVGGRHFASWDWEMGANSSGCGWVIWLSFIYLFVMTSAAWYVHDDDK